jgi:hypothetical protein
MSYGHAERNLAQIRQFEAETRQLLGSLGQTMVSNPQDPSLPTLPANADGALPPVRKEQR